MQKPFMPRAIAVWLIENTALTFKQIAGFCQLHFIEVEAIANEETHKTLQGINPVLTGETSDEEIRRCEQNPEAPLTYFESEAYNEYNNNTKATTKKESRFKRKNKPESILWITQHYPQINNYQIAKLLNSTPTTVKAIRTKNYWNYKNLTPKNPITLKLCEESALSKIIQTIKNKKDKEDKEDKKDKEDKENLSID